MTEQLEVGLDIGHGIDTLPKTGSKGIVKDGVLYAEHTFNSEVGKRVLAILEAHNIKVHMAQKPYSADVPLRQRSDFYNAQKNIKLICSIHANAAKPTVRGMCAFYYKGSVNGKRAAEIYKKYVSAYGHILYSGGTADWGDFHMLRETDAPTILTENSFMTNAEDFNLIFKSAQYIQETAEINARTILEYLGVKYMSDDKPAEIESVQIVTGGLNAQSVYEAAEFLIPQKWWAQIQFNGKGNPYLITGGLDPNMRAECETWLKKQKWSYKVYPKGKVPK